jgi:hypothetical protein
VIQEIPVVFVIHLRWFIADSNRRETYTLCLLRRGCSSFSAIPKDRSLDITRLYGICQTRSDEGEWWHFARRPENKLNKRAAKNKKTKTSDPSLYSMWHYDSKHHCINKQGVKSFCILGIPLDYWFDMWRWGESPRLLALRPENGWPSHSQTLCALLHTNRAGEYSE